MANTGNAGESTRRDEKSPLLAAPYGSALQTLRVMGLEMRESYQTYTDRGDSYVAHHETVAAWIEKIGKVIAELEQPSAGTDAYTMVAATAQAQIEATETLIHMIAATVMMKRGEFQSPIVDSFSVTFSPADMDRMHQKYMMSAVVSGMETTVSIWPRDDNPMPLPPGEAHLEAKPESLMTQDEPETPFEPQVEERKHERPIWAVRDDGVLFQTANQQSAQSYANRLTQMHPESVIQVENRFCMHDDCPAERCNHTK